MILKAKHHIFLYPFFKRYSAWIVRRNFHSIHIECPSVSLRSSLFVLSNHVSWWDGFWLLYLNTQLFHKTFYFMMLYEQLQKYWFFNYIGGFSVRKKSKTIVESIRYAAEILEKDASMLLVFPQGSIQSQHNHTIQFEKGIEHICKLADTSKYSILFSVNFVDYFSQKKPSLYMYISHYESIDLSHAAVESAYQEFYEACVQKQILKN